MPFCKVDTYHSFKPTNVTKNPSKWLHIGSKIVEVIDNNLTLRQQPGSFGTNLDFIIIKRIKCKIERTNKFLEISLTGRD